MKEESKEKLAEPAEEELEELTETAEEEESKEEELPREEEKEKPEIEAKPEAEEKPITKKAEKPPKEEKTEEIVEERIYTVPLGKASIQPPNKRASRAVRMLRSFIIKHMKLEARKEEETEEEGPKQLVISNEVNEKIWSRGIEKPPRKIRVRAAKDKEGNVTVYLAEGE